MNRAASNEAIFKKPLKSSKIKSRVFFKFVHDLKINPFFQPRYLIGSFVFNKCTYSVVPNEVCTSVLAPATEINLISCTLLQGEVTNPAMFCRKNVLTEKCVGFGVYVFKKNFLS